MYEVGWESRHAYLDVRTPAEFSRGRPRGAVNVPLLVPYQQADGDTIGSSGSGSNGSEAQGALRLKDGTLLVRNEAFVEQVGAVAPPDARLVVGSANKASKRASVAYQELQAAGYQFTLQMAEGFSGWRAKELPVDSDFDSEDSE